MASFHSPVLKAAFNSSFIEGQTQEYRFHGVREETLRLLVHWLYSMYTVYTPQRMYLGQRSKLTGYIAQTVDIRQLEDGHKEDPDFKIEEDFSLVELWTVGDMLLILSLQNSVIDHMSELNNATSITPTNVIKWVWKNTGEESLLRQWLLHKCAFHLQSAWITNHPDQFPKAFLLQFAVMLNDSFPSDEKKKKMKAKDSSDFHVKEIERKD